METVNAVPKLNWAMQMSPIISLIPPTTPPCPSSSVVPPPPSMETGVNHNV